MSATNGAAPVPEKYQSLGYGASSAPRASHVSATSATDFGSNPGALTEASPTAQSVSQPATYGGRFNEEWDASQRGSSIIDGPAMQQSHSGMSQGGASMGGDTALPSRGGTLKKKASLRRRSSSRRSSRAGSVRSLALQPAADIDEMQSAFFSPVPTTGNPTEILANRFQVWRKVLKDLITYFKEVQLSYEHKAKSILKVANVINNTQSAPQFLNSGGIDDALQILRGYHKTVILEANKARDIEQDVILALSGLRSDLSQKIKEIKNLSGDFKNSVDKEMENTRRAVKALQEGLGQSEADPSQITGKQDPYLLKIAVDRQVERQIDEENYLHQAYLNLEHSGRELEQIVVGEIQKSYNALAGILRREADSAYNTIEELRTGPIAMPKDHEWNSFVEKDDHFVDPNLPIRQAQYIQYPGRDSELTQEVRAGLLERKSKYLKSYTAGWYVLSPTHLHEFKSADKTQAPIMSLYLPEQKLGSHSNDGGSSNKFMLKGRQTGSMHRGHSWVFRAESFETMMAWYHDIQALADKTPQERNEYVRQHVRSTSNASQKPGSISSDGLMEEDDDEPFSAAASVAMTPETKQEVKRPAPGGRFPSTDLIVNPTRGLQVSPSSGSSVQDRDVIAAAGNQPGFHPYEHDDAASSPTHATMINHLAKQDQINPYTGKPLDTEQSLRDAKISAETTAAAGVGAAATGATAVHHQQEDQTVNSPEPQELDTLAAAEAASFAAPDTEVQLPHQAAIESTDIAVHNFPSHPISSPQATPANHTEAATPSRPASETRKSEFSISQLHVPGEYPKGKDGISSNA